MRGVLPEVGTPVSPSPEGLDERGTDSGSVRKLCLHSKMRSPKQFRLGGETTRNERNAEHDRRRGSAASRGYNRRWSKARDTYIREHPLCVGCQAVGRIAAAEVVDHVDPHHGDPDKFWNTAMWQACCKWHHDVVKQKLERMYAAGACSLDELHLDSATARRLTEGLIAEG